MRERELNIIDLLVNILMRWRVIIVWMIVGGIIMAGVSYQNSVQSVEAQKIVLERQKSEELEWNYLEDNLTAVQKNEVRAVLNYEDFTDYYNQATWLQIDAASIPRAEITFRVKASDIETAYSIKSLYEDAITNGFVQWLVDKGEEEQNAANVNELVSVSEESIQTIDESFVISSRAMDSFKVKVIHVTEEKCKDLLQSVIDYVYNQKESLAGSVEEHELQLVTQSFAFVSDAELLERQYSMLIDISNGNTNKQKLKNAFSADQSRYYFLLKNANVKVLEGQGNTEEIAVPSPKISVKYVVFGMLLFAFMYVFFVFLKYILNNRLQICDDVRKIYGITQLALVPADTKKKCFVDEWIIKLRNRNVRVFSQEDTIELVAASLKMYAKKEGDNTLYCIGCNLKGTSEKILERLRCLLEQEHIHLVLLDNIVYNQVTMERLSEVKSAFLLEKAGETLYDEIEKELELLQRQDVKVIGVLVVE